jgi:hypothetical protein
MFTFLQTEILAQESNYKVVTTFEDAHLDYVSAIIEYKFFKSKCLKDEVSKRRNDWNCRESKNGDRKKCSARFSCQKTLFPGERADKKKELIRNVKRHRRNKGNGKLRIKIGKIKEKVSKPITVVKDNREWEKERDCELGFCWFAFQFAGLRVSDDSGSALFTMNFSWTPKYTINKDWSLFVKAGGHLLSSSSVTSFLVFDTGVFAEYRFDRLALEFGLGRQVWNDTSGDVLGYINLGLSYYLKDEALFIIDKYFINYTSISSERGVGSLSIGAGIEF